MAQLIVVQQAYEARQQSIRRKIAHRASELEAEEEAPSHMQLV